MDNMENKSEYERVSLMYHQLFVIRKNKKNLRSKWRRSREFLEETIKTLDETDTGLRDALDASVTALLHMQILSDNEPLKKIMLKSMDGEPVWVVSRGHDGRWGIVSRCRESVVFPAADGTTEEFWFDGNYIFRYKKEIKDYTRVLDKYGLTDTEEENRENPARDAAGGGKQP